MRLNRLTITNFRNLDGVDVRLVGAPVVVGENRVGKSNLVHAIRLVLDSSLSSRARWLRTEDFSEHLGPDPMADGAEIRISVELEDFGEDPGLMAALRHAIVSGDPLRARMTFRFGLGELEELQEGDEGFSPDAYQWSIYGREDDDPHRIPAELRARLHHEYLAALRDVEGDLRSWWRSPLRNLLEQAARDADPGELERVREALQAANVAVSELGSIQELAERVGQETARLVGELHALEPTLQVGSSEPERAVRDLRLLLDGSAQRPLSSASLGSLNVLYLALLELELDRRVAGGEIQHAVISIEEPEAHLHPHLQRRVFRKLEESDGPTRSTLVTTHSPHIVSVTDPRRLVVLRPGSDASVAFAAIDADLAQRDWDDISRYLDVTRSEMVFARNVLLVEGLAEQLLMLPMAARAGVDLDAQGITVCAVGGVYFDPYVRFLTALGTPHAVVTDGDPRGPKSRTGEYRMKSLADKISEGASPEDLGLFFGQHTLEVDLYAAHTANANAMLVALKKHKWSEAREQLVEQAVADGGLDPEQLMSLIGAISKGRFAQRLAGENIELEPPGYVRKALDFLSES